MKFFQFSFVVVPLFATSCMAPMASSGQAAGGVQADPNNPFAVPGISTQGGYAPAAQAPYQQAPVADTAYQPIPSTNVNIPVNEPTYTPPSNPAPIQRSSGGSGSHTVTSGDTLWGLSRKYNVSVDSIRQANGLTGDTIVTGQTISIPR